MSKTYYESHITIEGNPDTARAAVETVGWKFSQISGDIVLGDGVKCYATRHFNSRNTPQQMQDLLHQTADKIAESCRVVRRKVELVLYDDRSNKVKPCDGACIECHLDDLKSVHDVIQTNVA